MPIKTTSLRLIKASMLTKYVKHFSFAFDESPLADYKPGQFVTLYFEKENKLLRRSYSIANRENNQCIEFAASYVENGPASELLFSLKPGDTLNFAGPFGRLVLKDEPVTRYLLIATSTGVTPYRAMLESLNIKRQQQANLQTVIMQGVPTKLDLLYGDEFVSFANSHDNNDFYACYSQEKSKDLAAHERLGHVQDTLKTLNPNPETDIVYLCGNPRMVDDVFEYLKTLHFEIKNIRREKYISS